MRRILLLMAAFICAPAYAQLAQVATFVQPPPAVATAIAFHAAADLGNNGGTTTSLTASYTVGTGTNRLLVIAVAGDNITGGADDISSVTYGGVAATLAGKSSGTSSSSGLRYLYFYYLLNPPSGANNVVVTAATAHYLIVGAADYSGVAQTGQPDVVASPGVSSYSGVTVTATTTVANDWTIMVATDVNGTVAGTTQRAIDATFKLWAIDDSNGPIVTPGSTSLAATLSPSGPEFPFGILVGFKP